MEEINGLVQNAKGLVVRNARWAVYKCQMVRDTKRQRARVRNANGLCTNAKWFAIRRNKGLVVRNAKWTVYKCQMGCVQMPNAVSANENGYAQRWD